MKTWDGIFGADSERVMCDRGGSFESSHRGGLRPVSSKGNAPFYLSSRGYVSSSHNYDYVN